MTKPLTSLCLLFLSLFCICFLDLQIIRHGIRAQNSCAFDLSLTFIVKHYWVILASLPSIRHFLGWICQFEWFFCHLIEISWYFLYLDYLFITFNTLESRLSCQLITFTILSQLPCPSWLGQLLVLPRLSFQLEFMSSHVRGDKHMTDGHTSLANSTLRS